MNVIEIIAQVPAKDRGPLLFWLGVLMAVVIVGGAGLMLFRRRLYEKQAGDGSADTGFSLASLREMRDRGEITEEEYQRAREKVVSKVKRSLEPRPEKTDPQDFYGGEAGGKKPR